jgi:hypothetical protein
MLLLHSIFFSAATHVIVTSRLFSCRLKHGQGVPMDDAEGERLTAEAIALGFDVEAAKAASGQ